MDVLDKVREVIAQKLGLADFHVASDSEFAKLGADSLDMLEIANELEYHFEIDLTLADI